MGAGSDGAVDLGQMGVHRRRVDAGQDQPCRDAARRADRAKQIGPLIAGVARRAGSGAARGPDAGQGGFCTGRVQNLYRQEDRRIDSALRRDRHIDSALRRSRRIARIPQPFEDQVGIQRLAPRNLRHANIRCRRPNTDRTRRLVSPKPFRAPNHQKPNNVRYPKRTLSNQLSVRQGRETGRLRSA